MREIVEAGHAAVGVDVSRAQIERARRNAADVIHASALDVDFEPESFDAVVAFYVVDHLPRETHPELLAKIHRWLRPGGWLLITFDTAEHPGAVGEWLGVPMFFSQHDPKTSERLVADAGFEVVSSEREAQLEGAREVTYLWVLAQKNRGQSLQQKCYAGAAAWTAAATASPTSRVVALPPTSRVFGPL
jgi:SAM-dependent methyltransferase